MDNEHQHKDAKWIRHIDKDKSGHFGDNLAEIYSETLLLFVKL